MICGFSILFIIYCVTLHGLFAVSWCLLPVLVGSWILTTRYTTSSAGVSRADTLWDTLSVAGMSCLVVGLSFLSHVWADVQGLGF
ncbi:hypothetical protein ES703_112901 [subsurface metagenome]